jgi:hypothetical protein
MIFIPLTVIRVGVTVILKEPFSRWWSNCKGHLKSLWNGSIVPLLCCYASLCITAAHCCQSMKFSNCPCTIQGDGKPKKVKIKWLSVSYLMFSVTPDTFLDCVCVCVCVCVRENSNQKCKEIMIFWKWKPKDCKCVQLMLHLFVINIILAIRSTWYILYQFRWYVQIKDLIN